MRIYESYEITKRETIEPPPTERPGNQRRILKAWITKRESHSSQILCQPLSLDVLKAMMAAKGSAKRGDCTPAKEGKKIQMVLKMIFCWLIKLSRHLCTTQTLEKT